MPAQYVAMITIGFDKQGHPHLLSVSAEDKDMPLLTAAVRDLINPRHHAEFFRPKNNNSRSFHQEGGHEKIVPRPANMGAAIKPDGNCSTSDHRCSMRGKVLLVAGKPVANIQLAKHRGEGRGPECAKGRRDGHMGRGQV